VRRPNRRLLLVAVRRFLVFVAAAAVFAFMLGLVVSGIGHENIRRGIAVGFYITGAALAGLGFLAGSRPPVRTKSSTGGFIGMLWSGGGVRWATPEEHAEAMNLPAVLVCVGIALIPIGIAVDSKH
jgi:MFS family permease